jgi:hypothetical protein
VEKPVREGDEEEYQEWKRQQAKLKMWESLNQWQEKRNRERRNRLREDPPPPYTDVIHVAAEFAPKSSYSGSYRTANGPGSSSVMDSVNTIYAADTI